MVTLEHEGGPSHCLTPIPVPPSCPIPSHSTLPHLPTSSFLLPSLLPSFPPSSPPRYPRGDSIMPDLPGNGTRTVYYNQMATLLFSTGGLVGEYRGGRMEREGVFVFESQLGCVGPGIESGSRPFASAIMAVHTSSNTYCPHQARTASSNCLLAVHIGGTITPHLL